MFVGEQPENGGNIHQLARWGLVIYKTITVYELIYRCGSVSIERSRIHCIAKQLCEGKTDSNSTGQRDFVSLVP